MAFTEQTSVAGQVQTEINCLPVENEEYRQIMEERTKQALKPKRETKFLTGNVSAHGGNLLAPGTLGAAGNFENFIVGLLNMIYIAGIADHGTENDRSATRQATRAQGSPNASE